MFGSMINAYSSIRTEAGAVMAPACIQLRGSLGATILCLCEIDTTTCRTPILVTYPEREYAYPSVEATERWVVILLVVPSRAEVLSRFYGKCRGCYDDCCIVREHLSSRVRCASSRGSAPPALAVSPPNPKEMNSLSRFPSMKSLSRETRAPSVLLCHEISRCLC